MGLSVRLIVPAATSLLSNSIATEEDTSAGPPHAEEK